MTQALRESMPMGSLTPEEIIACIILSDSKADISSLSKKLIVLKKEGIQTGLANRIIPGGYYSEDIALYVNLLLRTGDAKEESPLQLTQKGVDTITRIVDEAYNREKDHMGKILNILKLKIGRP